MKIQLCEHTTRHPLSNRKIQLQVQGKDAGFLTVSTDHDGWFQLDDKYQGQQISLVHPGQKPQFISAKDGIQMKMQESNLEFAEAGQGHHGHDHHNHNQQGHGGHGQGGHHNQQGHGGHGQGGHHNQQGHGGHGQGGHHNQQGQGGHGQGGHHNQQGHGQHDDNHGGRHGGGNNRSHS